MRKTILMILCAMLSLSAMAQNSRLVRGVVFDGDDIPLKDAKLEVVGMNVQTTSGENGSFELYVSPYAKRLVASMEGYISQTIEIDGSYLVFKLNVDMMYLAQRRAQEEAAARRAQEEEAAKAKAEADARKAAEKEAAAKAKAEENARKAAETKDTTDAKAEEKNDSTISKLKKLISAKDNLVTQDTEKEEVFVATYVVGDIYDQNGKNAIVFKTYSRGQHGLALYISQTPYSWEDAKNWCAQLGEGWRLPTPRELQMIYDLKNNGKFNNGLLAAGLRMTWNSFYWSGEEVGYFSAKVVAMNNGNSYDHDKELMSQVCAICKF